MKEYMNDEHLCEEQKDEEEFAAFMEEQMRKEAEQIEKELENNPEIAGLSPDDSAKDRLYEKIEEYERQQAVRKLSPEDQEALRLGREMQKEKAKENEKEKEDRAGHRKKRFFKRLAGIAAVFVIVAVVGITGVGGPERAMEVVQQVFGGRKITRVESDNQDILEYGDDEEELAYQEIKDKLGIDPVRIINQQPDIKYLDMQLDEEMRIANVLYEQDGEIISYIINCSQEDEAWGADLEDALIQEYTYPLENVNVTVQEYKVMGTDTEKYTSRFEYRDVHYQLTGIMTREEMEEILNNLHFL